MAKKSKPNETGVLQLRRVPKHLIPQFKAACALRNKSMKHVLMELMKTYIRTGRLPG